jgi:hypothetical protein
MAADALSQMSRMARAVAEGQEPPGRLLDGLRIAISESDALAQQMGDDTFVTDEASRDLQRRTLEALQKFSAELYGMAEAVNGTVKPEALLAHLEGALAAERNLRELYQRVQQSFGQMQEALERSSQVQCIKCGHRNRAGQTSCEKCRFQLPQTGAERIETDIIGGEELRESAYLTSLNQIVETIEEPGALDRAIDFLRNLEKLHVLASRQVDGLLKRADAAQPILVHTQELRARIDNVRDMLEAVRQAAENGDVGPLLELPPWLAEEFSSMQELKQVILESTQQGGS